MNVCAIFEQQFEELKNKKNYFDKIKVLSNSFLTAK